MRILIAAILIFATPTALAQDDQYLVQQLMDKITKLQGEIAELRDANERLRYDFTRFKERVARDLERAQAMASTASAPTAAAPADDESASTPAETVAYIDERDMVGTKKFDMQTGESEQQAYRNSVRLLQDGDFAGSRTALSDFLVRYPNSKYSPDAKYWIAETYYTSGDYQSAQDYYARVIKEHKRHPRREDAMLRIANIREANGSLDKAILIFERLAKKAKNKKIRSLAQKRLEQLKQKRR